jgi:hypothetical protein
VKNHPQIRSDAWVLPEAPADLTASRLKRLGEGIGKVAYASTYWVVKRDRHPSEILSLIFIWKLLRRLERLLPGAPMARLIRQPGRRIRLLRVFFQAIVLLVPRGWWWATHSGSVWMAYARREARGRRLAESHLGGTGLVPERISFPPTRLKVDRWPGWIIANEAVERVETTLDERLNQLARQRRFDELELWLDRLLTLRQTVWEHGVFSLDAHLKNFGVTAGRVILLDTGGLTDRWTDIEARLAFGAGLSSPHEELGLAETLRDRPDIARRFNQRWRATVNPKVVRAHWPG